MGETFYVTTPIYYVNDVPHIGHAYCNLAADIIARFKRLTGQPVYFLTGTDEHGQKVEQAAKKRGLSPKEHCDQMVVPFIKLWGKLGITYDRFIRTTDPDHEQVVQHIFDRLYRQGDIYKDFYEGFYCVHEETYYPFSQAKEGKCPECGRELQRVKEKSYYFRCSKYTAQLIKHIEENPTFVQPDFRRNEVISLLREGAQDVCVSRLKEKVAWGIPVPFDSEHVIYVWFDALINYLTGAGYLLDNEKFSRIWPADVHLIGKDILRFHAIIWPSMLMALDIPLPKCVFATGFWTLGGEKISKSKGVVIDPVELIDEFGIDAFRYFFFREISFGQDGEFTRKALVRRINFDLANDLGNFVHRTASLYEKLVGGLVPSLDKETEVERALKNLIKETLKNYLKLMDKLSYKEALEEVWKTVRAANKYIDETAPWQLSKDKKPYLNTVLYYLAELARIIGVFLAPFLPSTVDKIWRQFGASESVKPDFSQIAIGLTQTGSKVIKTSLLFPRLKEDVS